jgi:hypothetical protein
VIRPAVLADKEVILDVLEPYTDRYPVRADYDRAKKALTQMLSGREHFTWVSEDDDGTVCGVLLGLTGDNLWAQRKNCNILAWVSTIPGDGAKLLREFRNWVRSRRAIKVAGMCPDLDVDPRIWQLAERIGFKKHGGSHLLYN